MSDTSDRINLIDELQWRGLFKDCTDEPGLRDHLADPENAPRKIYAGFDPTADSLTIGNLVPIMLLAHVKRAGHTPVVVMGGGTGLIGDPSGKSAERQLNTADTINGFIEAQRPIYSSVLGKQGEDFILKNNAEWLTTISYIEALRDIGKHFSVNMMMQKESVRARLNEREQGISYTEFSYMILQAYDFAHLCEHESVTVQFGGSDQYGNIVAGVDLIWNKWASEFKTAWDNLVDDLRQLELVLDTDHPAIATLNIELGKLQNAVDNRQREQIDITHLLTLSEHVETLPEWFANNWYRFIQMATRGLSLTAYGLTNHLVQKADGTKFGKTESGAIWLTAARTSPYSYYQFWLNATDDDARNWIKIFTFLPEHTTVIDGKEVEGVTELIARHDENPGKRELQRTLAKKATTILHGEAAMQNAEAAGKALFSGDIATLDQQTMLEVFASVPTTEHSKADLAEGVDMVALLKDTNLATSNREARDFLKEGSVSINGTKIDTEFKLAADHLLHGSYIAIRRGKKKWHMTKWS